MPAETARRGSERLRRWTPTAGHCGPASLSAPPRRGIAAFALVSAGCGAVVANAQYDGALGAVGVSLVFGLVIVYELVLTAVLMFVIMAVATDAQALGAAAVAIGGTVGLDALFGGPVTGPSMNRARSFGSALASGEWAHFWIYFVGPVSGAVFGALAYQLVRGDRPQPTGVAEGA